ncbi:cation:proton antiporter [Dactylosporangium sp. CA-139066]|uniref:cation:proton antiporter n=1 Tax=Dactylosporangium sp. CA-139066 TaxID=3239930 RepID=UPI003D8BE872
MTLLSTRRLTTTYLGLGAIIAAALAGLAMYTHHDQRPAGPDPASPTGAAGFDVPHILLTVAVLVAAAHLGGAAAARLRQPRVIGQATAGLLLGPSVLGQLAPNGLQWLHSGGAAATVDVLGQLGVILFVLRIGQELAAARTQPARGVALLVGHTTVVVPLLGGVAVAVTALAPPAGIDALPHALFVGLAMSATALPVLAHILAERGQLTSPIGGLATAAAAVADATIWCLLAVTMSLLHRGSLTATGLRLAGALLFAAAVWWVLRPAARRLLADRDEGSPLRPALLVCTVLACAVATERLGLHAIFGAFLAGLALPAQTLTVRRVMAMAEGVTEWLLLPLFFTAIGARTRLDLLTTGPAIALAGLVLAVAITSKLASGLLAGRSVGLPWRDATTLGVLLNCRGVTELVLLGIGSSAGLIDARTFAVFVVMAVVTTAATGPLLDLLRLPRRTPTMPHPFDETAGAQTGLASTVTAEPA